MIAASAKNLDALPIADATMKRFTSNLTIPEAIVNILYGMDEKPAISTAHATYLSK